MMVQNTNSYAAAVPQMCAARCCRYRKHRSYCCALLCASPNDSPNRTPLDSRRICTIAPYGWPREFSMHGHSRNPCHIHHTNELQMVEQQTEKVIEYTWSIMGTHSRASRAYSVHSNAVSYAFVGQFFSGIPPHIFRM